MTRICDAIQRYSAIRVVGLCHQIYVGYAMVGLALAQDLGIQVPEGFTSTASSPAVIPAMHAVSRQAVQQLDILAAGLNHFTWMLELRHRPTGEDLYPLFRQRWAALPETFEPLTRRVFAAFDLFPIPGDEHLCEYLPWVSDPLAKPWEKYDLSLYEWELMDALRGFSHTEMAAMGSGEKAIDHLKEEDSEGALEIIATMVTGGQHHHLAYNLPNQGSIANLPEGAIVETPGMVTGAGVQALPVGALPEGIAELCRRELRVGQLGVDAAVHGDRQAALQCLLLDPVVTDLDVARLILDDYLEAYREHLPQFWR
jgi:alpha-galactosidase